MALMLEKVEVALRLVFRVISLLPLTGALTNSRPFRKLI